MNEYEVDYPTLVKMARSLIVEEFPFSDEEDFERMIKALLDEHKKTGEPLDTCWVNLDCGWTIDLCID